MLVRPSSTLRALASGHGPQPAALGLAVPMAVATLANLAGAGTRLGTLGSLTPPWEGGVGSGLGGSLAASVFLSLTLSSLALWLAWGAVLHVAACALGGRGSVSVFMPLLGLSYVPEALAPAVAAVAAWGGSGTAAPLALALHAWHGWLAVLAVAAAHRLPIGRAAAAVLLPVAGLLTVAVSAALPLLAAAIGTLRGP
ncbi:MAG: YIP1 family protein, partial [Clostridia bacterium]|nr:YIP1 family protein [Clostridia bacterium]